MEYDNEIQGGQNSYTTQFRQYDPRLGRWKSLDPLRFKAANITPYRYAFNSPIMYSDKGGDFERQVIIVELGDGKELYLVRKVNERFMRGRTTAHIQGGDGVYFTRAHYYSYETTYRISVDEFKAIGENLERVEELYTPDSRRVIGDERFSNYFYKPLLIDDGTNQKDHEFLVGLYFGGNIGKSEKDAKTYAKYTKYVDSDIVKILKLIQKSSKIPRGKGIDWNNWEKGKTLKKIAEYIDGNVNNASDLLKRAQKLSEGGIELKRVFEWGEGDPKTGSRPYGKTALYDGDVYTLDEEGQFIYSKGSNKLVLIPEGYVAEKLKSGSGNKWHLKKKQE